MTGCRCERERELSEIAASDPNGGLAGQQADGTLNERTDTDTGWTLEALIPWANFRWR
jgi:hypothetical protein